MRIRVEVSARPEPALLRAAIRARLAGRPFPSRAEDEVGRQVARAVLGHSDGQPGRERPPC